MTLIEHLEELRYRLIVSFLSVGVGAIAGWYLYDLVIELLTKPYCDTIRGLPPEMRPPTGCRIVITGAVDGFVLKLKVVAFLGLALALPIVLYQLWAFIVPGLTAKERRLAIPFVGSSVLLFAAGTFVAYVTLPRGLDFLLDFAGKGVVPLLQADKFIGFVITLSLAFGLAFEFPLLLIFLSAVGIVTSERMRSWRRYTVLFIALFAALITPSGDPWTMLSMMVPMVVLYEGAILVARLMGK